MHLKLGNPKSESLREGLVVHLRKSNGQLEDHVIDSVIDGRILTLEAVEDRNAAEKLLHSDLYIDRGDFPELSDDEIYLSDMLGFVVVQDEQPIGSVIGFSDNGAQLLVEVRSEQGKVGFIPYVKPLIVKVDQAAKRVVVDIPQGLFDHD